MARTLRVRVGLRTGGKGMKLHPNPHIYLGINEEGELQLYCSPFLLSKAGPRLLRDGPFPHTVYRFTNHTEQGDEQDLFAIQALRDFTKYLHPKPKKQ